MTRPVLALCLALATTACSISMVPAGTLRHAGAPSRTALDPHRIEVLVWNVYKASRPGWWSDFQHLARQHDLMLLQEGRWNAELERGYLALGRDWWMGVTFVSGWLDAISATGTMVGSAAPVVGVVSRHAPHVEPMGTPKSHTFGRIALAGRADGLLVASVHALAFRPDEETFAAQLAVVMRDVGGHHGPAIVAGDFNTWSEWRTEHLFETMRARGFRSVYPRSTSPEEDGRTTFVGHYLDHAFVHGLDVVGEPEVLTAIDSSDHEALSFVVRVPAP